MFYSEALPEGWASLCGYLRRLFLGRRFFFSLSSRYILIVSIATDMLKIFSTISIISFNISLRSPPF